jgi:hypothetical protein
MPALAGAVPSYIDCVTIFGHDERPAKWARWSWSNGCTRGASKFSSKASCYDEG